MELFTVYCASAAFLDILRIIVSDAISLNHSYFNILQTLSNLLPPCTLIILVVILILVFDVPHLPLHRVLLNHGTRVYDM
jgi:hypothetical protein